MAGKQAGLEFVLSAKGADGVVREIGRVGAGIQGAHREVERGGRGWEKFRSGIHQATGAVRGLWNATKGLAAITGIAGGLGFASVAKSLMDSEDAALRLRYALGDDSRFKNIQEAVERMRSTTGLTAAELYKAIDAAADFGMKMEDAASSMEDMVAFSKLLGVNVEDVSKVVGAISKATGGKVGTRQALGMVGEAAKAAGMPEEVFTGMAGRALNSMTGLDTEGVQRVLQIVGGLGLAGTGREGEVRKTLLGLENLSPKQRKSLGGNMGASGAETMLNLVNLLRSNASALDRADLPDNIKMMAKAIAENAEIVDAVGAAAAGSRGKLDEFGRSLDMAKESTGTKWAGLMEDLKKSAEPLVRTALSWLLDNKEYLVGAVAMLGDVLMRLGQEVADILRTYFGVKGTESKGWNVRGHIANVNMGRAESYQSAAGITPEERNYLRGVAGVRSAMGGPAVSNADLATALNAMPGIRSGVQSGMRSAASFIANIIVNATPDTVHSRVDAEQDGVRVPAIATAR